MVKRVLIVIISQRHIIISMATTIYYMTTCYKNNIYYYMTYYYNNIFLYDTFGWKTFTFHILLYTLQEY